MFFMPDAESGNFDVIGVGQETDREITFNSTASARRLPSINLIALLTVRLATVTLKS